MKQKLYQVDAFAGKLFEGNPAAVCPLSEWLPDKKLRQIAMENNLSETAYFVQEEESYRIRWFTPTSEVDLCGHATLASAHVLFEHLQFDNSEITFSSNSGPLTVRKEKGLLVMNFPASVGERVADADALLKALGAESDEIYRATDYLVVLKDEGQVRDLEPDLPQLNRIETRGVIVTAPGNEFDFVSRFFAPAVGVDEDPVTGSAHTMLAPYWSGRLGKEKMLARQVSKRGGTVHCKVLGERVEISGEAITYFEGIIEI
ncbi:PhzF family phenazine biosynthesis protein [Balneolaceae bacterium YR4-1]|uniref:PhzF family phenazine biosynthesis protein n=1 Tax=Halalkalibaculum roseum TaxID=2709311 RepID=A0A6M1SXX7_9BACT|nr:PhzF family phenazine biosynthesis protein [Halalkalibaculum roseum]NGP75417.1 PhzF family phenazine biosynthesis protein [Halalkalibaculum roseum]